MKCHGWRLTLENSLQLYDNDWSLIEDENYRALADSYFDQQECKVYVDMHVLLSRIPSFIAHESFFCLKYRNVFLIHGARSSSY